MKSIWKQNLCPVKLTWRVKALIGVFTLIPEKKVNFEQDQLWEKEAKSASRSGRKKRGKKGGGASFIKRVLWVQFSCGYVYKSNGKSPFSTWVLCLRICLHQKISANHSVLVSNSFDKYNHGLTINCFIDIDECAKNTHECGANAYCSNTKGGYNCTCHPGYYGDGKNCEPGKLADREVSREWREWCRGEWWRECHAPSKMLFCS